MTIHQCPTYYCTLETLIKRKIISFLLLDKCCFAWKVTEVLYLAPRTVSKVLYLAPGTVFYVLYLAPGTVSKVLYLAPGTVS